MDKILSPEVAEEILRENGFAEEADEHLREISEASGEKATELIALLCQRATEVLSNERAQERIDASWARLAS